MTVFINQYYKEILIMKEIVLNLWEGKKAEEYTASNRQKLADSEEMTRAVHAYGRSQCRTTHKRQDC
jgi:hypothetical protein